MTVESMQDFYERRINRIDRLIRKLSFHNRCFPALRFIGFIIPLLLAYFFTAWWLFLFVLFLILIAWDSRMKRDIAFMKNVKALNIAELENKPKDGGEEFINTEHPYSFDLDFFGQHSLFAAIDRTHSLLGIKKLAHLLQNPLLSKQKIEEQQAIIKELADKISFRDKFRVNTQAIKKISLALKILKISRFVRWGTKLYPFFSIGIIFISIFFQSYIWIGILIVFSILINFILRKKIYFI